MRGFDARGDGLQIEQRAAATRARDVIGLERAAAGRLQNVVGEPQRLPAARFAADENGVADAVREQRADVRRDARSRAIFGSSGISGNASKSLSRIGLFRPSRFNFAASRRKAVMAGSVTPSFTVTSCVLRNSPRSPRVGSTSSTFRSS